MAENDGGLDADGQVMGAVDPNEDFGADGQDQADPGAQDQVAGGEGSDDDQKPAGFLDGLSDEDRAYAESKGFREPAQAIRAQREAEANMHRMAQMLDRAEGLRQAPAPQTGNAQQQDWYEETFAASVPMLQHMESEYPGVGQQVGAALKHILDRSAEREQALIGYLGSQIDERIAPVTQVQTSQQFAGRVNAAKMQYGADFDDLWNEAKPIVEQTLRTDPSARTNPGIVDNAMQRVISERYMAERRSRAAQTLDARGQRGSARRAQMDPIEQALTEMDAAAGLTQGVSGGL